MLLSATYAYTLVKTHFDGIARLRTKKISIRFLPLLGVDQRLRKKKPNRMSVTQKKKRNQVLSISTPQTFLLMLLLECQHSLQQWWEKLGWNMNLLLGLFFKQKLIFAFSYFLIQNQGNIFKWRKKEGDKVSFISTSYGINLKCFLFLF